MRSPWFKPHDANDQEALADSLSSTAWARNEEIEHVETDQRKQGVLLAPCLPGLVEN